MKIFRVSTVAFFIESQLKKQIIDLLDDGIDVHLVSSDKCINIKHEKLSYHSIEICRKISILKDIKSLINLYLVFLKHKPDIVHSTTPKAGLLCAIAGYLAGVPVRLHTYTGQPWVEMSGLKRMVSKWSDKIINFLNVFNYADSKSQMLFLIENNIVTENKIKVLGCGSLAGVDIDRFNPYKYSEEEKLKIRRRLNIDGDNKVLTFVGRLSRDKGIYDLLDAFERIIKINSEVHLILVGPDEDFIPIKYSNIKDKISIVGFSDSPEEYMSISDLLILPSYREGFGTVIIEAAAMGVPTLGSDIYGISDAVVNEETGYLVPVKRVDLLSEKINFLLNNDDLLKGAGRLARTRALDKFSSKYISEILIDEYHSKYEKK